MTTITAAQVKDLRERTGAGMMECKNALSQTEGNIEQAIDHLRKKGVAKAAKKAGRETREGAIGYYIHHNGKVGVLVEICCETDFVAKNDTFQEFSRNVSMHIAVQNPSWLSKEDVPADILERESAIHREQIGDKPPEIQEKIITGKLRKFYEENCLLNQKFIKDDSVSIGDLLTQKITELGENLSIRRYARLQLGG